MNYYNYRNDDRGRTHSEWVDAFHRSLAAIFHDVAPPWRWENPPNDLVEYCCQQIDNEYDKTVTVKMAKSDRPGKPFKVTQVGTSHPRKEISQTNEWQYAEEVIHRATRYMTQGPKSILPIQDSNQYRTAPADARTAQADASSTSSSKRRYEDEV